MKERAYSIGGTVAGPATLTISVEQLISTTTPIITWIGLILGVMLTTVMLIYWLKKLFKKEK